MHRNPNHSYPCRAQNRGNRQKTSASWSLFPWKECNCMLYKMLPDGLVINTLVEADCDPTWNQKEPVGTSPTFSLQLTPTIKPTHQTLEGTSTSVLVSLPNFCSYFLRDGPLDHLARLPAKLSWVPQDCSKQTGRAF